VRALHTGLLPWGWDPAWEALWHEREALHSGAVPARVVSDHGALCHVELGAAHHVASVSGRILADRASCPVAGDWVAVLAEHGGASIVDVLPRRSLLRRQAAGEAIVPQNLAANVDIVAVVTSLNRDLNLRRIERFLAMIRAGRATPVVVLTKADLVESAEPACDEVRAIADDAPVLAVSAHSGQGFEALRALCAPGRTVAFLGSSGTGKSTLVNHLAGWDVMVTQQIRTHDDRGRHTTSHRQLVRMGEDLGVLLDTPGLREVLPWIEPDEAVHAFPEIEELSAECHFRDCSHRTEAGCAVREAVASGVLPAARLAAWEKLQRELRSLQQRSKERGPERGTARRRPR
jgi:ribosome biogenesis GTPase